MRDRENSAGLDHTQTRTRLSSIGDETQVTVKWPMSATHPLEYIIRRAISDRTVEASSATAVLLIG
jgi:hypothetical protein